MDIPRLLIGIVALLISVILHEIMHAWSALKMGDPTGRDLGRITLNPIPHLDPWNTFLMPLLFYFTLGIPFGGAKPVPINPLNFKNPGRGFMISSAAGPLTNFGLAVLSFGILYALFTFAPSIVVQITPEYDSRGVLTRHVHDFTFNGLFLALMIVMNVLLGAFNLIPVPPLDGSRVIRYLLSESGKTMLDRIEPFGLLVIVALLYAGVVGYFLWPFYALLDLALGAVFPREFVAGFERVLVGR